MANKQQIREVHEGPHKYSKAKFKNGTIIYTCGLTNCPHYIHEPMIIGKLSLCWRCGYVFIITKKTTTCKKFHCERCTRGKYNKPKEISQASQVLESEIDKLLGGNE